MVGIGRRDKLIYNRTIRVDYEMQWPQAEFLMSGNCNETLTVERMFGDGRSVLPRFSITHLPTPVERLGGLERETGAGSLWVKRDDRSAKLYGGNKPRKLELLLGDALDRGFRRVLTFGGIGTHHGLATTICARAAGLDTTLVLVPQPPTPHVLHCLQLCAAFGADLRFARSPFGAAIESLRIYARTSFCGGWPYLVFVGGSSPLGTAAFVNAALELAEQVRAGVVPEPDWIVVPIGSGGTVAGLLAGLELAGLKTKVLGVMVTDIFPPTQRRLLSLGRASLRCLRRYLPNVPVVQPNPERLRVEHRYLGGGYGAVTGKSETARQAMQDLAGIKLETTYTGKCAAAFLDLVQQAEFRQRVVLFWNTYSSIEPEPPGGKLPTPDRLPEPFRKFFSLPPADRQA